MPSGSLPTHDQLLVSLFLLYYIMYCCPTILYHVLLSYYIISCIVVLLYYIMYCCPTILYHVLLSYYIISCIVVVIMCIHVHVRNPSTSERPQMEQLTQSLGRSDTVLLKWDVSDKPAAAPLALKLGAPLTATTLLYPDLQRAYLPAEATDNDYEEEPN